MFGLVKERRSFITGSQAYGSNYRTSKSDIDLVIFVSEETLEELRPFIDQTIMSSNAPHFPYDRVAKGGRIKLGDFDLILVADRTDYDRWKEITNYLKSRALKEDLTKEKVKATFRDITGDMQY